MREWLVVYAKGFAMGAADAVPGVSGGTIALITGIYDRLIAAVASLTADGPAALARLREGHNPGRVAGVTADLVAMDVPFLVALGLGVVSGVATLANVVDAALHAVPALTFAFFFGLILASPWVLRREVRATRGALAAGVAGFTVAFYVSGLPERVAAFGPALLVVAGAIAISAMVLPGISGSLILLILGPYEQLTGAVSELTDVLFGSGGDPTGPAVTLAAFSVGAFVGILSFARLVALALAEYRAATMAFLVGVMVGALRTPGRRILEHTGTLDAGTLAPLVAVGVVGAATVLVLDYATDDVVV
jgi:putative membrane protein